MVLSYKGHFAQTCITLCGALRTFGRQPQTVFAGWNVNFLAVLLIIEIHEIREIHMTKNRNPRNLAQEY